jgi:hypothetical protein
MRDRKPRRIPLDFRGLSGRSELFRISGAAKHDVAVDIWFAAGPLELRLIAKEWFVRMRECGDDVRELMHDDCPVACVADVPFGYVDSFRSHVNVGFFCGAMLDDPAGLLEGSGNRMRHVKLHPDRSLNGAALSDLIHTAYVDIRHRLDAERSQDR